MFLNLPVKDLNKSIEFFTKLGFTFNPQFTDKNATCMIIGENIFAMLLVEGFFKTFIQKPLSDAKNSTECIIAISFVSKVAVNEIADKALAAGAKRTRDQDYGWMYQRGFEDLDGHLWEVFFYDESAAPKN
ncbi:MAG TPA: VOC family protein [archaeon]|nr:VOC family protein [archaeon]